MNEGHALFLRYVFWIDCCENPHVGRVGMDGQDQSVIVNKEIYSPSALTTDYTNKRIYWADDNHIFFANMDGSQRHRGTKWVVILFWFFFLSCIRLVEHNKAAIGYKKRNKAFQQYNNARPQSPVYMCVEYAQKNKYNIKDLSLYLQYIHKS